MRHFLVLVMTLLFTTNAFADLPRRGSAGVAVAPQGDDVVVREVFPGRPAELAGLRKGDVVRKVDGEAIATTTDFTSRVLRHKAGETVTVDYVRSGEPGVAKIVMQAWPMEQSSDKADVRYGEVTAGGHRYRTIVSKPKGDGPFRTLFIVQGLGCGSVDNPPASHSYRQLVDGLVARGYATLRVDKPGVGDSEGGPCATASFRQEVDAYRAALASLKNEPWADQKNVFMLGHSMGGIQAPLIATAFPLRGLVVYGTEYQSWLQYTLENEARQMRLGGAPFEAIEAEAKLSERLNAMFYVQKMPLEKIVAEHPEFRERFPDGGKTYTAGKAGKYFQELYDTALVKAWKETNVPVLSVWGASDFLTDGHEHEWLAAAVNSWRPGTARYVRLEGIDHWLRQAKDQKDSMAQAEGEEGPYSDKLEQLVVDFMKEPVK